VEECNYPREVKGQTGRGVKVLLPKKKGGKGQKKGDVIFTMQREK